ncbi:MAG TPA: DUF5681 domain-containing protein [Terriglobales bacterium]|nr:DUF5681 domain-containing protein [Terriglobales bacterium]
MMDYEVGYGKPPKVSQFKKGESGNPRGRAKHTRNLKTDLTRILGQKISVREGDRKFKVSGQEGVLMSLMAKSLKGDTKAITTLINLAVRIFGTEGAFPDAGERFTPQEQQMLAELDDRLRSLAPDNEPKSDCEKSEVAA